MNLEALAGDMGHAGTKAGPATPPDTRTGADAAACRVGQALHHDSSATHQLVAPVAENLAENLPPRQVFEDRGAGRSPGCGKGQVGQKPRQTRRGPGAGRAVRFAALGDSLTEGVGDPVGGGWRGWAALLAGGLAARGEAAEFRNFAVSGALTRDVADHQTPRALAYAPDIASVVVGVNDTLRRSFDIQDVAVRLDAVCSALTESGAVLLTACLPDPGTMLGLAAPLARPLARRQRAVNAVVHALSARYGAVHLHVAEGHWVTDRSLWSADRLHPGERGHRLIAARFHSLLAAQGLATGAPPGREPEQPPPTRAAALLWLLTAGTGWLARRSTDLLPQLLGLAATEVRHGARGTSARLDLRASQALSAALAAVSTPPLAGMGE